MLRRYLHGVSQQTDATMLGFARTCTSCTITDVIVAILKEVKMERTVNNYRRQDVSWTKAAERTGVQTERAALHVAPAEDESARTDNTDEESAQKTAS